MFGVLISPAHKKKRRKKKELTLKIEVKFREPALQHHVGGDDELNAGDVFDGEVVAKTDEADDETNEKA